MFSKRRQSLEQYTPKKTKQENNTKPTQTFYYEFEFGYISSIFYESDVTLSISLIYFNFV